MIKPRIPGQSPFAIAKAPSVPPVAPVVVQAPAAPSDLAAPLQARLTQVTALLAPLLKEQSRLTKALQALSEDS